MNTVIYGTKILSLVNTMGTGLIIKTLTTTTSSIYSAIRFLTSYEEPKTRDALKELVELDIEFTVSVLEDLVKEYKDEDLSDAIKKSVLGVNETLEHIDEELKQIKTLINDHNQKYFSGWRCFDCKKNIKKIKEYKTILDSRRSTLIDLLKIYQR